MANRAYLLNTAFPTNDPSLVETELARGKHDYVTIDGPAYRLPIPWLLCFRPEDLKPVGEGTVYLPATTVEQAIRNLQRALPTYVRLTGEKHLARIYWEGAIAWLRALPLPYLTLNLLELYDLVGETGEDLAHALGADAARLPALLERTGYVPGVPPYPPDVFRNVSGPYYDEGRNANTILIDACDDGLWCRVPGGAARAPRTLPAPRGHGDLGTVRRHVGTLVAGRDANAHVVFGFMPRARPGEEGVKMLLWASTDRMRDKLLADGHLRAALGGFIADTLHGICAGHGLAWAGFVIESVPGLKRRIRDTNDWVTLAPAY